MKIAFFSDNFYPELSGITDTIIITGKKLRERGHDICYVAPRYSEADYKKSNVIFPSDVASDTIDGIPVFRLPSIQVPSPTGQSRLAIPLGRSVAFLKTFKPDVIHTQSPYGAGLEAKRVAKRLGVPLVGTNHTAIEDFLPMPIVMRAYDAWYYNHCDFVTTPYSGLIERMREKGFKKPARALANPVKVADFTAPTRNEKEEDKKAFGLAGPVILYVGRLGVEKKVDVVFRAITTLVKEFKTLTFVMTGHGAAEQSLKALARKLGIEQNVRFTGFLSHEALPHIYKTADAFAMMSTSDSQSIALMQAYASGVPAVCARARGLPDYTPADVGYIVDPGDYRGLASKLRLLLTEPTLHDRMSESAVTFVQQFSPDKIAAEWEKIYQNSIDQKN